MNVFLNEAIANNYDSYYDTLIGKRIDEIEKEAIKSCFQNISRQHVLELGCGTGHWSEFLSRMGFYVTATDISDAMLAIAIKKSLEDVAFQKADACNLPFHDESFGIIVSITMLEFTDNVQKVLNEIYRVLMPNGILILGCLNINSELGKAKDKDATFRNAHFFSKDELKSILSIFGNAEIAECVYLTPSFEILDETMKQHHVEGAFLTALVKKSK
jgi:ubiquinone/menaquinone biosynthesis C-methylase UbiE